MGLEVGMDVGMDAEATPESGEAPGSEGRAPGGTDDTRLPRGGPVKADTVNQTVPTEVPGKEAVSGRNWSFLGRGHCVC